MANDSQDPIIIIGAGLGGLSLAHAFETHNIPFQLFERDTSPSFRAQGYRIRIQDYYLKQLLPADLFAKFENCNGEINPIMAQLDALMGQPLAFTGGQRPRPVMTEGRTWNVDRMVLRNLMMAPMVEEGKVQFGKKFVRYEIVDDGVIAYFADGTQVKGRLLVGADGTNSLVRKQLIPDFSKLDSEGRAVFGKTLIEGDLWDKLPKGIGGLSIIADMRKEGRPMKLFCDTMVFKNRDKVDVELPEDYLYWVLAFGNERTGMDDARFLRLSKQESVNLTLQLTEGWHESCREIMRRQVPDAASTLAFGVAHPDLKDWQPNAKVTLLGDAAHPMTPVGGVGANSAFQDATLLLKAILDGGSTHDIAAFERTMRENSRIYIAASILGSSHMFGMKPVEQLKAWELGH